MRLACNEVGALLVMWMWDPIDYVALRSAWFNVIGPMVDVVFLNEAGRESFWLKNGCNVHFVGEGCMVIGDSGPGFRPRKSVAKELACCHLPPFSDAFGSVFLGQAQHKT